MHDYYDVVFIACFRANSDAARKQPEQHYDE